MGIRQLFQNRSQILEGLRNNFFKKEHVEIIAQERLLICEVCPSFDESGDKCYVAGTQPCCASCGCCLAMKTRSLVAECPLLKWPALLTEQEADALPPELQ